MRSRKITTSPGCLGPILSLSIGSEWGGTGGRFLGIWNTVIVMAVLLVFVLTLGFKEVGIIASTPGVTTNLTTMNVPFTNEEENNTKYDEADRCNNTAYSSTGDTRRLISSGSIAGGLARNNS